MLVLKLHTDTFSYTDKIVVFACLPHIASYCCFLLFLLLLLLLFCFCFYFICCYSCVACKNTCETHNCNGFVTVATSYSTQLVLRCATTASSLSTCNFICRCSHSISPLLAFIFIFCHIFAIRLFVVLFAVVGCWCALLWLYFFLLLLLLLLQSPLRAVGVTLCCCLLCFICFLF